MIDVPTPSRGAASSAPMLRAARTASARSSNSTAACSRRRAAPTCRCSSGCATSASSRRTWTSSSRCALPTTSRRRASPAPASRSRDLEAVAADGARADRRPVRGLQRRGDAGAAARRHRHRQPRRAQRGAAPLGRRSSSSSRCGRCWCRSGSIRRTRSRRSPTSRSTSSCGSAGRDAFGRENTIAIVKVPRVLPRVIRLPDDAAPPASRPSCC